MASITLKYGGRFLYQGSHDPYRWYIRDILGTILGSNLSPNGYSSSPAEAPAYVVGTTPPDYIDVTVGFPGDFPTNYNSSSFSLDVRYGEFRGTLISPGGPQWVYSRDSQVPRARPLTLSAPATSKTRTFNFSAGSKDLYTTNGRQTVVLDAGITVFDGYEVDRVEWDFGDGSTLTTNATGTTQAPSAANDYKGVFSHADVSHTYTCPGNYSGTVKIYDTGGRWRMLPISVSITAVLPTATISRTIDGGEVTWNGSASSTPNGTITSYLWTFHDATTATGAIVTKEYDESGTYSATLQVTDSCGLQRTATSFATVVVDDAIFGSFVDKAGVLFTAVNEGTAVRVSQFKAGTASRILLASIANAKSASLFNSGGRIYCAYTDRTDGSAKIRFSDDGAITFSMPVTVWPSTHQNAVVASTLDGGAISAASVKNTSPIRYEFRRSADVLDWSKAPVIIGTATSGKTAHVHQKSVSGQSTLIATNGVQMWISFDLGKNWDPF